MTILRAILILGILLPVHSLAADQQTVEVKTRFAVKYVVEGAVYLEGGRNAGLKEGQKLTVRRIDSLHPEGIQVAEVEIVSIASASAACAIRSSSEAIRVGDEAVLETRAAEELIQQRTAEEAGKYAQIVTFTDGDPLEEEMRGAIPRPPLPEINRARGRIGFEYNTIQDILVDRRTLSLGLVLRIEATRLMGTYWNLNGYYRGRLTRRDEDPSSETLSDLIQRTYHLGLVYNNPSSGWVAGAGRLLLPWASSLGTIDGGYFGRRMGKTVTLGMFGGSSPDPTSWRYDRNRQLAGAFVNLVGGGYDSLRFSSTFGAAAARISWKPDREFAFFESTLLYRRSVSLYYNLEADRLHGGEETNAGGQVKLSRSFLTMRFQPHRMISLDINHNYFREIPTFDERLLSTGLVDRLLFQGVNAGVRLEFPYRISPYATIGRSSKTGDTRGAWNRMYGLTLGDLIHTGIRADMRYSKFDSSFGRGIYRSLSLSRPVGENLRFEIQGGQQNYVSAYTLQNRAWWATLSADWILARHYFLGGGFTQYRSPGQGYNQWYLNLSYAF
jgi:hypothetical protein